MSIYKSTNPKKKYMIKVNYENKTKKFTLELLDTKITFNIIRKKAKKKLIKKNQHTLLGTK